MRKLPQVLINVRDVDKNGFEENLAVAQALAEAEADLGDSGRVLLRPSGTELVIRVMVEAQTDVHAQEVADKLASVVKTSLALG
jgi:phosphoglucosamine mutase